MAFSSLYPSDVARLLACTRLPFAHACCGAVLVNEVDLKHGPIQYKNKTDDPRA